MAGRLFPSPRAFGWLSELCRHGLVTKALVGTSSAFTIGPVQRAEHPAKQAHKCTEGTFKQLKVPSVPETPSLTGLASEK